MDVHTMTDAELQEARREQLRRHDARPMSIRSGETEAAADSSWRPTAAAEQTRAADRQVLGLPWQQPTEEVTLANWGDVMRYQPWDPDQTAVGDAVRDALYTAGATALRSVPRSPHRTLGLRHLIDARMDFNAAISFRGRF